MLAALKPDVVCLQEVVPAHLDGPEIRDLRDRGWWISEQTIRDYGVILVTRRPVRASERIPLPSVMGRELLVVQLDTRPAITVATVHLESTPRMTGSRCRQLRDIHARLADGPEVLLVGDMNFPAGDRPEAACLPDWTDVWRRSLIDGRRSDSPPPLPQNRSRRPRRTRYQSRTQERRG